MRSKRTPTYRSSSWAPGVERNSRLGATTTSWFSFTARNERSVRPSVEAVAESFAKDPGGFKDPGWKGYFGKAVFSQ